MSPISPIIVVQRMFSAWLQMLRPYRGPRLVRPVYRALALPCICTLLGVIASLDVAAQSLDYAAMEQLFGEPVTSSATGKPQRASDAPVNMEIITQKHIRRSGATSIPDVLKFVLGIDVRRSGLASVDVGIRGYNQAFNPRLLVLINGRQVYSDDFGHMAWPTLSVQLGEIRQIELIKGPNSALYGFNAVSGVINIITSNPLRERVNSVTAQGGTQDYSGGSLVGTRQVGYNAAVRVSLGGFRARDFASGELPPSDRNSRNQSPKTGALNIDGRVRLAPGIEAFAEASLTDSHYAEKVFTGSFDVRTTRANALRAGMTADTALGLLSLSAYRNSEKSAVKSTNLDSELRSSVDVVQASDLVKPGVDHTLRFGLEYRKNSATSAQFFRDTTGYADYAASVMWNWQIAPDLSWTNAARVDSLKLTHSGLLVAGTGVTRADYNASLRVPSFNSGLVYNLTQKDTLRLMVARGVQLPSLVDFGLQFSVADGRLVFAGNPGLHPSTVDSIELDYDRGLPSLGSSLRIAAYAQRNRDLISQPFGAPPVFSRSGLLLKAANVGSSDAAGLEVGIKGHAESGLRWQASYAYAVTTDDTRLNQGGFINSPVEYAHSTPRHVVLGGLGYTRGRLELDLLGRWQSSFRDFETGPPPLLAPVEVRNYLLLSGRIGYRLTDRITAAFSVQQFNSARQLQTAGPPVERRAIFSVTAEF